MFDKLAKLVAPIRARVANMIARSIVKTVDDSTKMQIVQLAILEDETREVERVQNYGFTSVPPADAEAVVLFVGGRRDHGFVVAVDSRDDRLKNLESGEVAVYDSNGSKMVFKANGDIEITPNSGKVKVMGDLEATGDVKAGTVSLKTHTHPAGGLTTNATVGLAGPATIAGNTGAP